MRNVSEKSCRKKSKHIYYIQNLVFENRAVYEIMWKKYRGAGQGTDENTAHAHCVLDNTHSEYVIRIAFHCTSPPQCNVTGTLLVLFYFRARRHKMSFENWTENCFYHFTL